MTNGRHDVTTRGNLYRRIELTPGTERRRWLTVDEKLMIIAESYATPKSISAIARLHGLTRNQLYQWRRQFLDGQFCRDVAHESFVPVVIASPTTPTGTSDITSTATCKPAALQIASSCDKIEVLVGEILVRVPTTADEETLRRVLGIVRSLT